MMLKNSLNLVFSRLSNDHTLICLSNKSIDSGLPVIGGIGWKIKQSSYNLNLYEGHSTLPYNEGASSYRLYQII